MIKLTRSLAHSVDYQKLSGASLVYGQWKLGDCDVTIRKYIYIYKSLRMYEYKSYLILTLHRLLLSSS